MPSVQRKGNTVWFKRILIPIWTIRLFVVIVLFLIYALSLAAVENDSGNSYLERTLSGIWRLGHGQELALCIFLGICTATDILAFLLFFGDTLTAPIMVALNAFQLCIWIAMVVVQGISVSKGSTPVGLGVSFIPFVGYLAVLLYGIYVWATRGKIPQTQDYTPTVNPSNQISESQGPPPYRTNDGNTEHQHYPPEPSVSSSTILGEPKSEIGDYYALPEHV